MLDVLKELTPEEEMQLIKKLAINIMKLGIELPAIMFLEVNKPLSSLTSQTALLVAAPVLELFGIRGYKYVKLFSKMENVEKLIQEVERLTQEQEQREHAANATRSKNKPSN